MAQYTFEKLANGNVLLTELNTGSVYSLNPNKDVKPQSGYPDNIVIGPVSGSWNENKFLAIPWEKIDFAASIPAVSPLPSTIHEAIQALSANFFFDLGSGGGGGCPNGTNYIYVCAKGTPVENASELQAAYTTAQGMLPSATNRITIIASPGYYDFDDSPFVMGTDYIDLVSLDGNRSVIFNSSDPLGTISIKANKVFAKGVDVGTKNFTIGDNLNILRVENCAGGNYSFGGDATSGSNPIVVNGSFIDCTGGDVSFGGYGTASGIFTNCVGANDSFGAYGMASGAFTNCNGGDNSFGGFGTASGVFLRCTGKDVSFGSGFIGNASGTFTDCVGGFISFGGIGTASGVFTNCQAGAWSFGGSPTSGTASGVFNYCIADDSSFGGVLSGSLTGKLYYCKLTSGTFLTVSGGGRTIYCIDGNNNTNNQ